MLSNCLVNGAIVCPSPTDYAPCSCTDYSGDGIGLWLNCLNKNLDDDQISEILNSFLATPVVGPLKAVTLFQNRLNRVPDQIRQLDQLVYLNFEYSFITMIPKDAFNFSTQLEELDLIHNRMIGIEAGAFQGRKCCFPFQQTLLFLWYVQTGNYGNGSVIYLSENNLIRFESDVFLPVLQQMGPFPGLTTFISITGSMIQHALKI